MALKWERKIGLKYKVKYTGFCYVEADSESEAEDLFFEDDFLYNDCEITDVEQVSEFVVNM